MDENVLRLTSRGLVKDKGEISESQANGESSLDQSISTLHQAVNKASYQLMIMKLKFSENPITFGILIMQFWMILA